MNNELSLPAGAFQRLDLHPSRVRRNLSAQVAGNRVEAQVRTGYRTGRRQDPAVVGIEHVHIHFYFRLAAGQFLRGNPMRGRSNSVEHSGTRKYGRPELTPALTELIGCDTHRGGGNLLPDKVLQGRYRMALWPVKRATRKTVGRSGVQRRDDVTFSAIFSAWRCLTRKFTFDLITTIT